MERKAAFVNLVQGSTSVRVFMDKFEELYQYVKDTYLIEEAKSKKFWDGLHVSLRGKLNLYVGMTFRGWVEKVIEQEKLNKELESVNKTKSHQ